MASTGCSPQPNLSYHWDYGDTDPSTGAHYTGNGTTVSHTYAAPNMDGNNHAIPYNVVLTVTGGPNTLTRILPVMIMAGEPQDSSPGYGTCPEASDPYTGNAKFPFADPVMTRGYPLGYEIALNTQAVDTNQLLANASITYDIHVGTSTVYTSASCAGSQHYLVVDADGKRLDFGVTPGTPVAKAGIFSQLQVLTNNSGYLLTGAGEPGHLMEAGNFSYNFNSLGKLTQITDPQGNAQTLIYNGSNYLTQVQDVNTQKNIYLYYTGSQVTSIHQNGNQEILALGYLNNRLSSISVQNSSGVEIHRRDYTYYTDGTLWTAKQDNDLASLITVTYDLFPSRNCTTPTLMAKVTRSDGYSVTTNRGAVPASGAATTVYVTNAKGGELRYDYDTRGNVLKITYPILTGATAAKVETFAYNTNNQVTSHSDGFTSEAYGYTASGMMNSYTNGLSQNWSATYNGVDVLTTKTPVQQAAGVQDQTFYGNASQPHVPTSDKDASNFIWNYGLNSYGQVTSVTPPTGSPQLATTITYDETTGSPTLGWPIKVTDGNGDIATVDSYDSMGDVRTLSTYPIHGDTITKNSTQFLYDAEQRLLRTTRMDGKFSQNVYNGRHLDYTLDEAGTRYNYSYCGPCGALTGISAQLSAPYNWSLGWIYDGDHDLKQFTDARGNPTAYNYGAGGELTSIGYPDNTSQSFLYTNAGLVRQVTNGRGHLINLGYDNAERLSNITFPTTSQPSITIYHNTDDTVHGFIDGAGSTTYAYYLNGWVQSVIYNYSASGLNAYQELDYTYYPDGSKNTVVWKNGAATVGTWTYNYDAGGRLSTVTNPWSEMTQWTYDGEGKLKLQLDSNGTSTAYAYNEATDWPTTITHKYGASILSSYGLTYDSGNNTVGNLTHVAESTGGSVDYGYDPLYRLTTETRTGTNAYTNSFDYDKAGNRKSYTTAAGASTIVFDPANKVQTYNNGAFTYDADGNWISNGVFTLTYDDLNHLTHTTGIVGNPDMDFTYDARGLRVMSQPAAGTKTFYIFDGDSLLGEVQNTSGFPATAAYTWGANGLVSERLIGSSKSLWYHFGPQGETRLLTNSTGAVADTYTFMAYGTDVASSLPADVNPFRYGGQYGYYNHPAAPGTGYLCGQRWYARNYGTFYTRDPIEYEGGDNLYVYCNDNPVRYTDPSGEFATISVKGNNVSITVPISFRGGTRKNIKDAVAGIQNNWSGKFGHWHVVTKVILVNPDTTKLSNYNYVQFVAGQKDTRSFCWSSIGGGPPNDAGEWNTNYGNMQWVSAHEAGHLMGLDDHYKDSTVKGILTSIPNPGWSGDIMGRYSAPVTERDITRVIKHIH